MKINFKPELLVYHMGRSNLSLSQFRPSFRKKIKSWREIHQSGRSVIIASMRFCPQAGVHLTVGISASARSRKPLASYGIKFLLNSSIFLGHIYRRVIHCEEPDAKDGVRVAWIRNKILHHYYQVGVVRSRGRLFPLVFFSFLPFHKK